MVKIQWVSDFLRKRNFLSPQSEFDLCLQSFLLSMRRNIFMRENFTHNKCALRMGK
jgi:hypothetical protein